MGENKNKIVMPVNKEALVAAVTPKLPKAWILQVEMQFCIVNVTVLQTKFDLAVQKLNEAMVCCLLDLLVTCCTRL